MKKNIGIIFCLLLSFWSVEAQDVVDDKTSPKSNQKQYLPKKGDISVGVDISPVMKFIGNSFNGTGTNGTANSLGAIGGSVTNLDFAPKPDVSVMGKYLISDNIALRANLGVMTHSLNQREYVLSDVLLVTNPLSNEKVIDCINNFSSGGSFTLGGEYRIGKNRIQGLFGADLMFAYQTRKETYQYGNALTLVNSRPTYSSIMPAFDAAGYRTVEKYYGDIYYTGAMFNAGVEYFISPKFAIGTEVNLMCYYRFGSSSYQVREGLNVYTNEIEKREFLTSPGDNELVFGTGNFASKLYIMFYF